MGGEVVRTNSGKELPLRDWTLLDTVTANRPLYGVVCPDVFAADAISQRLRLTLLRSPYLAHHDPFIAGAHPRGVIADQGVHTFRFRFFCRPDLTPEFLESQARMMNCPPLIADLTRGMPQTVNL